jgi:hypothetical protein
MEYNEHLLVFCCMPLVSFTINGTVLQTFAEMAKNLIIFRKKEKGLEADDTHILLTRK